MGLHGKKKRLDVRRHPTEFHLPTPHGGLIRLAGIRRFSIHDVLDDRGLVVLVWKDEIRQLGMRTAAGRADAGRHMQMHPDAAFQPHIAGM